MTETGEEITLLPYDYDIGDDGGDTKTGDGTSNAGKPAKNASEGQLLRDDHTEEGGGFATHLSDKSEATRGNTNNGQGEHAELHQHAEPPSVDKQAERVEPEEPRQPERLPIQPHPESNFPQPNLDQPSPVHPYQPQPHSELPEPYQPQPPASASVGPEVCQIIATGMNTEMQQYASLLASEALTQFPNQMMAIARHIMMNFEERYGPVWCCAVSNGQLGFYLRYDRENHIYFTLSRHTIFLYKSGFVQSIMSDPQSIEDPNPNPDIETGNAQIIASGMDTEKQQYAIQCANEAIMQHPSQNMAMAQYIMSHFEERYGSAWHCIVSDGNLGFYVRYDPSNHIYFFIGSTTIFLFKNEC
ncbi:Dynein light chain type 1 family protein [Brugia pahangi]